VGTRHTGTLALMAQQHEVVRVIYFQSIRISIFKNLLPVLFCLLCVLWALGGELLHPFDLYNNKITYSISTFDLFCI